MSRLSPRFFINFVLAMTMAAPAMAADSSLINIARNRAAYQSDSADDDHTAHLATDGSAKTFWQSGNNRESWIAVDLGGISPITGITLRWGQTPAAAYQVQVSNDGLHPKVWKEIYATANGKGGVESLAIKPVSARHVRVVIPANVVEGRGCELAEFEVYGPRKSGPQPAAEFTSRADGGLVLSGGNWKLQNAMFVDASPADIALGGFDDRDWIPAVVPGTVLGSYLAIGAVPDPWYGDQMSQISESFFSRNDFWYRSHFVIPSSDAGRRIWLNFDGINWKAEIFLNGSPVGRMDGAFIRGHFDITSLAKPGSTNYLAVLIHQVAHPGPSAKKIAHKKLGSPTVNGDVLGYDSPTYVASAGWNWLPIVRGRNIGIPNEVRVETTAAVEVKDPWVLSELPLPATDRADLTVKTELRNTTAEAQRGQLVGQIGDITFHQDLKLEPGETRAITLDKSTCPELVIANPHLWWPNGYGDQPLYKLNLRFESAGAVSDSKNVTFGIRNISYVDTKSTGTNRVLTLYVNGKRILVRGGNWGMEEGMLNCDAEGYNLRVRLHHDANLNMIRNWVGMVGREAFYEACDRYGILIWDDFWLANPGDGPNPTDAAMFMANVQDKIRRVRSHPSLALYCGRNEGMPPKDLDAGMRLAVEQLDGTRQYIPHSAAGTVSGFGPYENQSPEWYFANRGRTFHSELGIVAVPPVESMRAMMPEEYLWPINDMWAIHDYQSPRMPQYTKRIEQRYGAPAGIEDYCRKAQMVNMESAKAMYECLQSRQGSGILLWMTQSAWPALICQLYDYYFEPTAAYFGAKKGCEPLHILWDCNADTVKVANNTVKDESGLTAEAWLYDLDGKEFWHKSAPVDLSATSAKDCFSIERLGVQGSFFIKLKLHRGSEIVSDNFYWSSSTKGASCNDLDKMPRVSLPTTVTQSRDERTCRLAVKVYNPSPNVALMIRLKVTREGSGERVLPVFYEDNYFSLLPGESCPVSVEFATADLAGKSPRLVVEGWNIVPQEIPVH